MADAFHPHASGLLVPDAIAREREVWTNDDWKRIKRAIVFLSEHGLAVVMRCTKHGCRESAMGTITQVNGTQILRCPHKDREIRKHG